MQDIHWKCSSQQPRHLKSALSSGALFLIETTMEDLIGFCRDWGLLESFAGCRCGRASSTARGNTGNAEMELHGPASVGGEATLRLLNESLEQLNCVTAKIVRRAIDGGIDDRS
jgi:hypothetical protein